MYGYHTDLTYEFIWPHISAQYVPITACEEARCLLWKQINHKPDLFKIALLCWVIPIFKHCYGGWFIEFPKTIFLFLFSHDSSFFKQKVHSYQVLTYLNVPAIQVRKPFQNSQIVEEQLDVWILGVICARLLTGRHLLINKKYENSQYTNIKVMIIWRKSYLTR